MDRRSLVLGVLATPFIASPLMALDIGSNPQPGDWRVYVSKQRQRMSVVLDGREIDEWLVSTARSGKVTPSGTFYPYFLSKYHKSSLYNNAPMPNSIFYSGNYAVHGTDQESRLGGRASAGCVRISRANSKFLFKVPELYGLKSLQINIA